MPSAHEISKPADTLIKYFQLHTVYVPTYRRRKAKLLYADDIYLKYFTAADCLESQRRIEITSISVYPQALLFFIFAGE